MCGWCGRIEITPVLSIMSKTVKPYEKKGEGNA